jgi:hypothetical protein
MWTLQTDKPTESLCPIAFVVRGIAQTKERAHIFFTLGPLHALSDMASVSQVVLFIPRCIRGSLSHYLTIC